MRGWRWWLLHDSTMEVPPAQSPAPVSGPSRSGRGRCLLGCLLPVPTASRCLSWGRLGEGVLAKRDMGLGAFVSGAGCRAFLMSKYVLFKETNKQSKTTNSSGFYSFVLNTNKQKEREKWLFLHQLFPMQVTPSLGAFGWFLSP